MADHENAQDSTSSDEQLITRVFVSIPLRIGRGSLALLAVTKEAMREDGPEIALVELAPDIFILGGDTLRRGIGNGCLPDMLKPEEVDLSLVTPTEVEGSVTLVLDRPTFEAMNTPSWAMDGKGAPAVALVKFGDVYRLGGDLIADFVEALGARAVWGSNIDSDGHDMTGENTYN